MEDYMVKNYKCIAGQTLSADQEVNSGDNVFEVLNKINLKSDEWLEFDKSLRKKKLTLLSWRMTIQVLFFPKIYPYPPMFFHLPHFKNIN